MPAMANDSNGRQARSVSIDLQGPGRHTPLAGEVSRRVRADGGWWPFDRFMHAALYEPGQGYYARGATVFGALPADGSDFITAPEMSPLFGRCLAHQVSQGLQAARHDEIWEFGAGSGALAEQLLDALDGLDQPVRRYHIVEVSGALRQRQRERLKRFGERVTWLDSLPDQIHGVVLGNEVLDAMPVRLLHFDGARWWERGVADDGDGLRWADRPTQRMPPHEGPSAESFVPGAVTEIHDQAEAFVRTLSQRLQCGLMLFIDYGFPQAEYYHPQRSAGTLVCHRGHRVDDDPLSDVGLKDITAHVNFTGIALAAQDAGADVLGYTSQGRFLLNCGLAEKLAQAELPARVAAQRLVNEHEMGELFKVLALGRGLTLDPLGFAQGDRMHRL